jgi:hypothetical protein
MLASSLTLTLARGALFIITIEYSPGPGRLAEAFTLVALG